MFDQLERFLTEVRGFAAMLVLLAGLAATAWLLWRWSCRRPQNSPGIIAVTTRHLPRMWVVVAMAVVLSLGWLWTNTARKATDKENRKQLLARVQTAAAAIGAGHLQSLTGAEADVSKPDYQNLKAQLVRIKKANPEVRFVYLMALKDGKVIFLAEAENPQSKDYSPPGEVYDKASPELYKIFEDGQSFTEGPLRDDYGVWISAFVALREKEKGPILAVMGMDVSARNWESDLDQSQRLRLLATLFVCVLLMAFHLIISLSRRAAMRIADSEMRYREQSMLQGAILNSANYIIISTTPDGKIRTFNAAAEKLLGYHAEEVVDRQTVEIFHDSSEIGEYARTLSKQLGIPIVSGLEALFARTRSGVVDEREWTYVRKDKTTFPVLLSVTALKDARGRIKGFLGIASDLTDRKKAEMEVRESHRRLEAKARDLAETVTELRLTNQLGVGRELEMIKLKREVNELLGRLNEPEKYDLEGLDDIAPGAKGRTS